MLQLDLIQTLAFGGVALLAGYGLRRLLPVLARLNMPAAVLGGLLVSVIVWGAQSLGVTLFRFDTTLQNPLMIAFFTTVGFGASVSLLRVGGRPFVIFLILASVFAVLQNVLGVAVALAFGLHPLFGVLTGSVALTGGPGTAASFAPLFEQAGVTAAAPVGIAVAMAGIVLGALIGGPVVTWLIHRHRLQGPGVGASVPRAPLVAEGSEAQTVLSGGGAEDDEEVFPLLKSVIALLIAMWLGSYVSKGFALLDITLPAYIGAMLVAALIRNLDDSFGWFGLSHRVLDSIGAIALSLFLSMALMNLHLWEIAGLALPLVVGLLLQVLLVVVAAVFVFGRMGRDYEAAVMSGGFIGFMLGTTANAMAVMRALVERYGAAPRAFLVAPLVGAFFIDFVNGLIVTTSVNLLK
ncbi:MAG: sodium/glutamate symporter [Steroidobacteraceae bacterium]